MFGAIMGGLGGFINGGLSSVVGLAKDLLGVMGNLFKLTTQFNDMAIKTTRSMGGSYQQSIGLTKALIADTKQLSMQYGVSAELLGKLQDTIIEKTGRAITMTRQQREALVQTNKILGEGVQGEFIGQLANMGTDIDAANKAMFNSIKQASSMGLSAREASSAVAKNLSLANKLPFQNGINGITKMTMLSQRLKFNLESAATGMASQFETIEGSIENAAKLQQLGGSYAAMGANPMTMLYEANNDPEAMVERMTKMFSGKGTFDKKTGEVRMSGYEMQMMKAAAQAMGISGEEAIQMNKNSMKNAQVESQMRGSSANLSEEQKAFVQSQAQYNTQTGKFEMSYIDKNGERATKNVEELSAKEIEDIQKQNALTTEQAIISSAQQVVSVEERMMAIQEMIGAYLAEVMMPLLPIINEGLMWIGEMAQQGLEWAMNWLGGNISNMGNPDWWMSLLGRVIGKIITGSINWVWNMIKNFIGNIWKNICSYWDNLGSLMFSPIKWLGGQITKALGYIPGLGSLKETGQRWVDEAENRMKSQTWEKTKEGLLSLGSAALDLSMFIPGVGTAIGAVGKGVKAFGMAVKIGGNVGKLGKVANAVTSPIRGLGSTIRGTGKAMQYAGKGAKLFQKGLGGGSRLKGYTRAAGIRLATIEGNQQFAKQEANSAISSSPGLAKGADILRRGVETVQKGLDSKNMKAAMDNYTKGISNRQATENVPETSEEQNVSNNTTTGIINRPLSSTANTAASHTSSTSTASSSINASNTNGEQAKANETKKKEEKEVNLNTINATIVKVGKDIVSAIKGVVATAKSMLLMKKAMNTISNVSNIASLQESKQLYNTSNGRITRNNYTLASQRNNIYNARNLSNTQVNRQRYTTNRAKNGRSTQEIDASIMMASTIPFLGTLMMPKLLDERRMAEANEHNTPNVKAKEYDGKVYISKAQDQRNNGKKDINVGDINVNINGTIKLETPNGKGTNIDVNSLMDNYAFKKALIEMVSKELNTSVAGKSLSQDINGRRSIWSAMVQGQGRL